MTTISPWEREPDCTDKINRALELLEERRHLPGIDAKELTLLLAYVTKLTLLLNGEMSLGELIVQEKLSLLRAESLREGSKKDRQKLREQIDMHKAKFQKIVEEDREKVRKILEDAGLT